MSISDFVIKQDEFRQLAQSLSHSTEKRVRDRAVVSLRKFIAKHVQNPFTETEIATFWKGLHYCMWHSDKPLIQEELADNIASLIFAFCGQNQQTLQTVLAENVLCYVAAFFRAMEDEWNNIDHDRIDKYDRLVRKMIEQTLHFLSLRNWREEDLQVWFALVNKSPLCYQREEGMKAEPLKKKPQIRKKTIQEKMDEIVLSEDEFEENVDPSDVKVITTRPNPKKIARMKKLERYQKLMERMKQQETTQVEKEIETEKEPQIETETLYSHYLQFHKRSDNMTLIGTRALDGTSEVLVDKCPGLIYQFINVFLDALKFAIQQTNSKLSDEKMFMLLFPFISFLEHGNSRTISKSIIDSIFVPLAGSLAFKDEEEVIQKLIEKKQRKMDQLNALVEDEETKSKKYNTLNSINRLKHELKALQEKSHSAFDNLKSVEELIHLITEIGKSPTVQPPNRRHLYHLQDILAKSNSKQSEIEEKEESDEEIGVKRKRINTPIEKAKRAKILTASEAEQQIKLKMARREEMKRELRKMRRKKTYKKKKGKKSKK